MRIRLALAVIFAAAFSPAPTLAWGIEGHQIVADIAEARLTPEAASRVSQILNGERLRDVAYWADLVRPLRPQTSRWHYVNIEIGANDYRPERDCQQLEGQGDCIIAAIDRSIADLRNTGPQQLEALKFLVHFVGDLHQPFHAVTEARGGNQIRVTYFGASSNLHKVWDTDMLISVLQGRGQLLALLGKAHDEALISRAQQGGVVDWALQSRGIGLKALVSTGTAIEVEYVTRFRPVMDEQIVLAGLRLAAMLNEHLR